MYVYTDQTHRYRNGSGWCSIGRTIISQGRKELGFYTKQVFHYISVQKAKLFFYLEKQWSY